MARAARKPKVPKSKFIQALEFLRLMGRTTDERSGYCILESNRATSFNSIIAAGTTIEEDLNACPHLDLLLTGLERCGSEYAITQLSSEKLLLRTAEFEAYIPCISRELLSQAIPDPVTAVIDDRLIDALRKVVPLLAPKAETILEVSIQLNAGSCIATDRSVLIEAWHGLELPSGLLLPKNIVTAIHKSKKHLKAFGHSAATATFYFEDDTWLRTQLFQAQWPGSIGSFFNCEVHPRKVPPYLFEAANKVAAFSAGKVFIKEGLISSHSFDATEEGSSLKLPIGDEHKERAYSIDDLNFVSDFAEWWDESARPDATYFMGKEVRGMLSHVIPNSGAVHGTAPSDDEDIPF